MDKIKIISLLVLAYVIVACGGGGSDDPVPTPTVNDTVPVIEDLGADTCLLLNKSVVIGANGGESKIVVKTNRNYELSTTATWITINNEPRAVSDFEHTITIAENAGAAREGVVKVKFEGTKKTKILDFKVIQTEAGVVVKEHTYASGINDMIQNDWEQQVMVSKHTYSAGVVLNFDEYSDNMYETEGSGWDYISQMLERAGYMDKSITDGVQSGELTCTYIGGYINDEYGTINTNRVDAVDVMVPKGYEYGFSVGVDGRVIKKGSSTPVAMTIGTNDFSQYAVKVNQSVVGRPSGIRFRPSMEFVFVDDFGDTNVMTIFLHVSWSGTIVVG